MEWEPLPENYQDAVWEGNRRYRQINNVDDNSVSFEDVTVYSQKENSFFSAMDANRMNHALNTIMGYFLDGVAVRRVITIPKEGWKADIEDDTGKQYIDITQDEITPNSVPIIVMTPQESQKLVGCRMSSVVKSLEGKLRLYSESAPKEDTTAYVIILRASDGVEEKVSMGIATREKLGVVKIGDRVDVTPEGTISADTADISDVEQALGEIFKKEE